MAKKVTTKPSKGVASKKATKAISKKDRQQIAKKLTRYIANKKASKKIEPRKPVTAVLKKALANRPKTTRFEDDAAAGIVEVEPKTKKYFEMIKPTLLIEPPLTEERRAQIAIRNHFQTPRGPEPLNCCICDKEIIPHSTQIPHVYEWGKRDKSLPDFLGNRPSRAAHENCHREKNGLPLINRTKRVASPVTTTAGATQPGTPKPPRDKKTDSVDTLRIYKLGEWRSSNPRKEGTHGHRSFEIVEDGMLVADYLKAGGRRNDLAWDVDHGFVKLGSEPPEQPPIGAKGKAAKAPLETGKGKAPTAPTKAASKPVPKAPAPPKKPQKPVPTGKGAKKGAAAARKRG